MLDRTFTVHNKLGLHARPAALFVQTTHKFFSQIRVIKDGVEVDGKSIMGILTLAAEHGSKLTIVADGPDEQDAIQKLGELFERKFDEE
ncbi:MAG: HPr family phosphocarrier protein [Elusimicrobia bacterium]|nr:HPr family phosphocarrier protein [Elusimicrobiota bacterium]